MRSLQRLLVMMKLLTFDEIDGAFGPKTDAAVHDFQSSNGLAIDGEVGPQTWNALPADPDTPQIARGAHGAVVTALQQRCEPVGARAPRPTPARPRASSGRARRQR